MPLTAKRNNGETLNQCAVYAPGKHDCPVYIEKVGKVNAITKCQIADNMVQAKSNNKLYKDKCRQGVKDMEMRIYFQAIEERN